MYRDTVTSAQNPRIKHLLALQEKSRVRREEGLFVVEGVREVERAVANGFEIETLFLCLEICTRQQKWLPECNIVEVPAALYAKIAYRGGTEGMIAELRCRDRRLEDLELGEAPLVMVLESVEKPGNLGAVLRTADAAGADALIVCDPLSDLYNPNVIRASTGAVFSVPAVCCGSGEAIDFLKKKKIRILTAQLQDSDLYYDFDMRGPLAIVVGTESEGLSPVWRMAADAHIRIPMAGVCDSLNAGISAAVLLYEAVRQRRG